jgi:NAD(P)-dependent dehydrogenase (short-subunit alcohol dehydrogenase family)
MLEFNRKVAVITGAAGGLGLALARHAAGLGMRLVLADVDEAALARARDTLQSSGQGAHPVDVIVQRTDVSDPIQVDALARTTLARHGAVHLLFNNAGVGAGGLIWENSPQDYQWVFGVNVAGVLNGLRAFVPAMLAQGEGHIVNTASVAGLLAPPALGMYNASKHAVVGLTETLYHDLALAGGRVHCSVLCPAYFDTGIADSERTRPEALRNTAAPTASQLATLAQLHKAVKSGKLSADDIAALTFAAVRENRFYILTHPAIAPAIAVRAEDLARARNPTDVYAPPLR